MTPNRKFLFATDYIDLHRLDGEAFSSLCAVAALRPLRETRSVPRIAQMTPNRKFLFATDYIDLHRLDGDAFSSFCGRCVKPVLCHELHK